MLGSEDDYGEYYYLVAETKFHDEQYFVRDNIDISPNR